jgi:hypothetical protein
MMRKAGLTERYLLSVRLNPIGRDRYLISAKTDRIGKKKGRPPVELLELCVPAQLTGSTANRSSYVRRLDDGGTEMAFELWARVVQQTDSAENHESPEREPDHHGDEPSH